MDRGIVALFSERQEFEPMLRMIMYESAQILFEDAVDNLCLTVCLRMVSRAESKLGTTYVKELMPQTTDENGIPVRNDTTRKIVVLANSIHE